MRHDSIFDFATTASPLGNWLPKRLAIRYRGYSLKGDLYTVSFVIRADSLPGAAVLVSLEESDVLVNEVLATKAVQLPNDNAYACDLTFPRAALRRLTATALEGSLEFIGRVTCPGVPDALTPEFSLAGPQVASPAAAPRPKTGCLCTRDFTADDLKALVVALRKGELTGEERIVRDKTNKKHSALGEPLLDAQGKIQKVKLSQYDYDYDYMGELLFQNGKERIPAKEATFKNFATALNAAFKEYDLTTCLRKIHFLAQAYHETQRFTTAYEEKASKRVSGGKFYRGRGLLQLTHDYTYRAYYQAVHHAQPTPAQLAAFVPTLAESFKLACASGGWYWQEKKLNTYADLDQVDNVSAAINYPAAVNKGEDKLRRIKSRSQRTLYYNLLKILLQYDACTNNQQPTD